ncbi:MAG: hypothetical protein COX48_04165, partial [bacterium (Candidatus Stahlbacteria) CG23_combo_of_CG06-09_8_20_14_all_34_7]
NLEVFAKKSKLNYYKTALVTGKDKLQEVETNSPLFGAVFSAEQNKYFYVTGSDKGYIFRVIKIEEIDQDSVQKMYEKYYQTIMQKKQQTIVADWMRNLKNRYEVSDYR